MPEAGTATKSPPPGPSPQGPVEDSPPPPLPLERRVLAALQLMGVEGGISEHSYRSAFVSGDYEGVEVFVHAYRSREADKRATPATVVGRDRVEGTRIVLARSQTFGLLRVFSCEGLTYQVAAPGHPRGPEIQNFLPAFIRSLGCEGA